jgi:hypothetical protein
MNSFVHQNFGKDRKKFFGFNFKIFKENREENMNSIQPFNQNE